MSINKWRIYCETESQWSYGYLDESVNRPTNCFTDTNHTVNNSSSSIIDVHVVNEVVVKEEDIATGGHFMTEGFSTNMLANTTTTTTISWPHPITVLLAYYTTLPEHIGDSFQLVSDPVTIGYITSNISVSDSIINVSSTVISHVFIGYEMIITDGTNTDFLDIITNINKNDNTITTKQGATHSFITGSLIKIQRRFLKNLEIGMSWHYEHGKSKIGGSYLPANTNINLIYTNNSNVDKLFRYHVDFLY